MRSLIPRKGFSTSSYCSTRFSLSLAVAIATVPVLSGAFLLGCKSRTATPDASKGSANSTAPVQPDDAAAVGVLETARAKLIRNKAGNIAQVDMREANGGNKELFAAAAKLLSLTTIICTGPDVTNDAVAALKAHPRLERLIADDRSAIGDSGAEILATIPNLTELSLERSEITDAAYVHFAKSKTLKRITAPRTKTTDAGLKALANSTQMELLNFIDCTGVSDAGILSLDKLTKMRSLKVWGRAVTDESLKAIGTMTNLASLGLQDTRVSGTGGSLSGLTKLTDVDAFRSLFNDEGLKSVTGAKAIKTLKLRDCQITAEGFKLLSGFANLERLDLSESNADNSTLAAIAGLPKLFELELWASKVTDEGLAHLTKLPLKTLTVEDVYDVTDAGMVHIGKIKTLESLTLSKTGVTDEGLSGLYALENLRELYLDNTVVSKKAVNALKAKLPKLEKVSF